MGTLFDTLLIAPITNLLVLIYQGLVFVQVPFALSLAIILLTVVIRVLLYPLTGAQLRSSKKMQDVAPHVSKLREKHKGDAMKLQQETMRVYKEHGINPAAGCLPVLIQLPIIWGLYTVLQTIVSLPANKVVTEVNKFLYSDALKLQRPWDTHLFGVSLAQSPSQLFSSVGPVILLVPVITGILQFLQTKMMFMPQPKDPNKKQEQDFATAFQTQSLYIFPAMIGFFSYTLPLGLSLYWNTFTIFGILQQYQMQGLGGLSGWLGKTPPTPITLPAAKPVKPVKAKKK